MRNQYTIMGSSPSSLRAKNMTGSITNILLNLKSTIVGTVMPIALAVSQVSLLLMNELLILGSDKDKQVSHNHDNKSSLLSTATLTTRGKNDGQRPQRRNAPPW
jgi:hypothetical protein